MKSPRQLTNNLGSLVVWSNCPVGNPALGVTFAFRVSQQVDQKSVNANMGLINHSVSNTDTTKILKVLK